jgi:hypothetical protein
MFTQLPQSNAARLLGALAVTLTLGLTGGAATPANADVTQWQRSQSSWNQGNGWNRQWRSQRHHRNQFNNGTRVIIGGGSGIIVTSPGFVGGNSGFIVRQPGFIVGQPTFVVRRPNFIFERPSFARKQWQFIKRHPSLRVGQPWWHKNWNHRRWQHNNNWRHNNWRHNGMRFTTPGMRFTTPGMRFTTQ